MVNYQIHLKEPCMISPPIETKQLHIAFDIATHAGPEDMRTAYLEVPWMQSWELHCGCCPGEFHSIPFPKYWLCNSHWEKKSHVYVYIYIYIWECLCSPLNYPRFVPFGSPGAIRQRTKIFE